MSRITNYCRLIGLAAILGVSNAAYAVCEFETDVPSGVTAPDRVTDLSGQGNFTCADITGSNGMAMREVTEVVFTKDQQGEFSWELPEGDKDYNSNGFVTNTPDDILAFPQGNGARCDFSYLRENAVKGALLDIGGNVDTSDSIACTDDVVNNEEAPPPPEPDIIITGDSCVVTLTADILDDDGMPAEITETAFDVFTATNLEGTKQAICSADPDVKQNECVQGCPKFIDIDALQADNICQPIPLSGGRIPMFDPDAVTVKNPLGRCTPCLTAGQAKADSDFPGFDTGKGEDGKDLKLCWEWNNSVDTVAGDYKPHKQVRDQATQTVLFNECIQTTTIIVFFGRERTKTVTTCF
jgi:hypothetical protein